MKSPKKITAKQKTLPENLQKAIIAKEKKEGKSPKMMKKAAAMNGKKVPTFAVDGKGANDMKKGSANKMKKAAAMKLKKEKDAAMKMKKAAAMKMKKAKDAAMKMKKAGMKMKKESAMKLKKAATMMKAAMKMGHKK